MGNTTSEEGTGRLFGEFKCPKCYRPWKSAHTWVNTYQQCKKCGTKVYPHKQTPLEAGNGFDLRKPHPEELCQRCQELGRPCTEQGQSVATSDSISPGLIGAPVVIGAAVTALLAFQQSRRGNE